MRVVASLTTMPDRYFKLPDTLNSLRSQTHPFDAIYLGLPKVSRRLQVDYPPCPSEVSDLCTVVECTDFGPITKLLGALLMESDPETVIISFDDDMVYPSDLVERLLQHHNRYPNSAIGSSGMLLRSRCPMCAINPNEDHFPYRISKFSIPPEGRRVDSVYGYPGALYVRKFFPGHDQLEEEFLNYALVDNDMYLNDDIVISGFLSLRNVERRIFDDLPRVGFVKPVGASTRIRSEHEISYNLGKFFARMNRSIVSAKDLGMYSTTEPLDQSETIFGIIVIVVVAILLIILFVLLAIFLPIRV